MSVRDYMAAAGVASAAGDVDQALAQYKKALGKLGTATTPDRAEIYVAIGALMRRQGKTRLAITNFDKALAIDPGDRRALVALVALNAAEGDWRAAEEAEDKFIAVMGGDEAAYDHLLAFGDRWRDAGTDAARARKHYERARDAAPERPEALERLLAFYEADHDVDRVIETRQRLLALVTDPEKRADGYFELGEYCMFEAQREAAAFEAFERVLDAEPTRLEALEVLATAFADHQEWAELERVYRKMIDHFAPQTGAYVEVRAELYHRLALLYRDHLEDPASALAALEHAVELRPRDLAGVLLAADLAEQIGDRSKAADLLRAAARIEPRRSETYHRLFEIGQRDDRLEIAYFAAAVAAFLGSANDRERIVLGEHRPHGVPVHSRPLGESGWERLRHPSCDPSVDAVMRALTPAVLRQRVLELERDGKLPALPGDAQDAATSTISAVRSLGWAAQYLGIQLPAVYVSDEAAAALAAPTARHHAVIAGRGALRGRSLAELAFMSGRHLALRRLEYELVAHTRSLDELGVCFLAGVCTVLGAAPAPDRLAAAVSHLAGLIPKHQTVDERTELEEAVRRFERAGGRVDLAAWLASVERTSCRAGLLLCGDIEVAAKVLGNEPETDAGPVPLADKVNELLAFCVSRDHLDLREALGTTLDA
ncbi:MAG: hypothetical protein HY908_06385 [Myxococcales bacterium]|nr:hypothetical protein [Myxococcales bacterium]